MINTTAAAVSTPSTSTNPTSLPPNTQQPKLTKKQKKALAFRDKSTKSKSKTKNPAVNEDELEFAQMEDIHVAFVEEPDRIGGSGDQIQVGGVEGQSEESAEGGGEEAGDGQEGARDVVVSTQENPSSASRQQQRKRKRVDADGDRERGGEREGKDDKKQGKKRKREQLDDGVDRPGSETGVPEKKNNKKRKREEVESRVGHAEEEGEGEEMSEIEGEGKKGGRKGKDKQRFILFVGK